MPSKTPSMGVSPGTVRSAQIRILAWKLEKNDALPHGHDVTRRGFEAGHEARHEAQQTGRQGEETSGFCETKSRKKVGLARPFLDTKEWHRRCTLYSRTALRGGISQLGAD